MKMTMMMGGSEKVITIWQRATVSDADLITEPRDTQAHRYNDIIVPIYSIN